MLNTCINNLRQIDAAKQQWALENSKTDDAVPTALELLPYLRDGGISDVSFRRHLHDQRRWRAADLLDSRSRAAAVIRVLTIFILGFGDSLDKLCVP